MKFKMEYYPNFTSLGKYFRMDITTTDWDKIEFNGQQFHIVVFDNHDKNELAKNIQNGVNCLLRETKKHAGSVLQQLADTIIQRHENYRHGVRVMMLVDRSKQNSNKGSKRWINKIITTNESEWDNALLRLLDLQLHLGDPNIRLYASVNTRKLDRAINMFRHREIDLQDAEKMQFYTRINNTFAGCLMKPENKESRFFLLDIDTKDPVEVDRFVSDNMIKIIHSYPTKNGWHYVAEPFDMRLAGRSDTFTVLKDGVLLLHYL